MKQKSIDLVLGSPENLTPGFKTNMRILLCFTAASHCPVCA